MSYVLLGFGFSALLLFNVHLCLLSFFIMFFFSFHFFAEVDCCFCGVLCRLSFRGMINVIFLLRFLNVMLFSLVVCGLCCWSWVFFFFLGAASCCCCCFLFSLLLFLSGMFFYAHHKFQSCIFILCFYHAEFKFFRFDCVKFNGDGHWVAFVVWLSNVVVAAWWFELLLCC